MRTMLAVTLFLICACSLAMCFAVMLTPQQFGFEFNRRTLKDAALIFGAMALLFAMTFLG